jgi:hypothetical protein
MLPGEVEDFNEVMLRRASDELFPSSSQRQAPSFVVVGLAMLPRGPLPSFQRSGLRGRHRLPPAPPQIREEVTGGGI